MPKIYEYFGLIFYFYSNEHEPVHVHIKYQEFESKVEIEYSKGKLKKIRFQKIKGLKPIPKAKEKEAETFIENFHLAIVNKWTEYFVLNKKPKNEIITQKL